ncbi:MAG: hypothetical protein ACE5IT_07610 [bacterium]
MINERKKKQIKNIIKDYKRLFNLGEYRITSRFKTTREDNDLKGCYVLAHVDNLTRTSISGLIPGIL